MVTYQNGKLGMGPCYFPKKVNNKLINKQYEGRNPFSYMLITSQKLRNKSPTCKALRYNAIQLHK